MEKGAARARKSASGVQMGAYAFVDASKQRLADTNLVEAGNISLN